MKRTLLSSLLSGASAQPTVATLAKPITSKVVKVPPSRRAVNVLETSFQESAPDAFTKDDYLIIDFVNESGTTPYGDFTKKVKSRLACWELTYRIRTIPSVYFSTEELSQQTLADADKDFDEVELFYVHQSYCDHRELNAIVKDILVNYLDPKTYLLAAQVKIQPLNLSDFLAKYGNFKNPTTPGEAYDINYWYDPAQYDNQDFVKRPLTSTPVPYEPK